MIKCFPGRRSGKAFPVTFLSISYQCFDNRTNTTHDGCHIWISEPAGVERAQSLLTMASAIALDSSYCGILPSTATVQGGVVPSNSQFLSPIFHVQHLSLAFFTLSTDLSPPLVLSRLWILIAGRKLYHLSTAASTIHTRSTCQERRYSDSSSAPDSQRGELNCCCKPGGRLPLRNGTASPLTRAFRGR